MDPKDILPYRERVDRLEEWRVFLTVARRGSFARAAEQHRCSPQAVTRAVAALEERVGAKLLHRTTRAVSLTDAGARRLGQAERLLHEADELESEADGASPLRGVLSVTAPVLYGQLHVLPIVARFLEKHPGLEVRLLLVNRVVSLVDEGIDVGVRIGVLPDSRSMPSVSARCAPSSARAPRISSNMGYRVPRRRSRSTHASRSRQRRPSRTRGPSHQRRSRALAVSRCARASS